MPEINYKEIYERCKGWDIRLQCTVCGFRVRRNRNDYNGKLGQNPDSIIVVECSNCSANANNKEIKTVHFVDIENYGGSTLCQ